MRHSQRTAGTPVNMVPLTLIAMDAFATMVRPPHFVPRPLPHLKTPAHLINVSTELLASQPNIPVGQALALCSE